MGAALRVALAALVTSLLGLGLVAHVRLETAGGNTLFWQNETNVPIIVNVDGSDDIGDESETAAIRLAIEEWNAVSGSTATLVEDTSPAARARTDWLSTDTAIVLFDEDDSSQFFPGLSGIVAVTPLFFQSNGVIKDADILFNGDDWQFTTTGEAGKFDVQDVVTHELGHLLGLDHTGWAGGTMYPYVDPTITLHRSLSQDEVHGLREVYPVQTFGRLSGTVERAGGDPVEGAHVVARDAGGRTVGGALSKSDGSFTLFGLQPGDYTVYAVPLDGPVSAVNLGDGAGSLEVDFEPALYGAPATVVATENVALGTLVVGDDVAVNLGESFDRLPLRLVAGEVEGPFFLSGTGLTAGSTLEASDPDLTLSGVVFSSGTVSFFVTTPASETPGHADLTVTTGSGDVSILVAALEITNPDPVVASVSPVEGSSQGGTALTITGDQFLPGARVVLGDQVYVDGLDAVVADANTITLTTKATLAGQHDVVVMDASGVEGRLAAAFRVAAIPVIQSLFPAAGDVNGGTRVVLKGSDFVAGVEVRIAGVPQTVDSVSATRITFTTLPSAAMPGVPQTLEVENPGGDTASSQFTFQAQLDPQLVALAPAKGSTKGGDTVTVSGANLTADSEVLFGVDPQDGSGGSPAPMVTFVDASTLLVMTPASSKGTVAVLVRDASSGQGSLLPAAFTFQSSSSGGGGCMTRPVTDWSEPASALGPHGALAGAWWMLLLVLATGLRARRAPARASAG